MERGRQKRKEAEGREGGGGEVTMIKDLSLPSA